MSRCSTRGRAGVCACAAADAAPPATIIFKYVQRCMSPFSIQRHFTGDRKLDAIQARAGGHIERFAIVSPATVGGNFRGHDRAEVLAARREDPYSAGTSRVYVA